MIKFCSGKKQGLANSGTKFYCLQGLNTYKSKKKNDKFSPKLQHLER